MMLQTAMLQPSVTAPNIGEKTPIFTRYLPFWGVFPKINPRSYGSF